MNMVSLHCNSHGLSLWSSGSLHLFLTHTLENLIIIIKKISPVLRKYRHERIFGNLCLLSAGSLQAS